MADITRRNFLQNSIKTLGVVGASQSLFPSWMPQLAFASELDKAKGDVLVNIFLRGGMDGLSAVAPYSEGKHYYDARPTQAVPEPGSGRQAGIDLDGRFALHPALTSLKEIYDDDNFAIIHATGSPDESRSHFDAMHFMENGTAGDKTIGTGWIGRHLQATAARNQSPFRAVGMGTMVAGSMRGFSSLALKSIEDFHFKGRVSEMRELEKSLAALYNIEQARQPLEHQAAMVFETVDLLKSLAAEDYQPMGDASYPEDEFGMGLKQIAQLIKADVGLEVASIDLGGWDTHEGQGTLDGEFSYLLSNLGQGLHAFYTDLADYMDNISVVTMSEFGRTLEENASYGTDHGHGNVMFLMGGGTQGGQVFCDWPTLVPEALAEGDLAITTDYRDVLAEVLQMRLLNNDVSTVFPRHQTTSLGLFKERNT